MSKFLNNNNDAKAIAIPRTELKIVIFDLYTLASTNINHSVPNLVKIYMSIRSWMCLIMGLNNMTQHYCRR